MSKEVLIPKKWVWDGVCTYSTRYEFLSKYFIKQPATAGTAGQVLALNSDLEPVWTDEGELPAPGTEGQVLALNASLEPIWKDEGELPAPGTEGQVLALNSSLEPVWQDDKTTTIYQTSDVPSSFNYKGDVYIPTATGVTLTIGSVHYLADSGSNDRLAVVNDVTSAAQMTAFVGIAFDTDDTQGVLIKGIINLGSNPGTSIGEPLYLTGSGALSATAPSGAGEYVRVMGHYLGNNKVFFNPSQDFILLS